MKNITERIYKYKLEVTDFQTLEIQEDAEILCVQTQPAPYGERLKEQLIVWAKIDVSKPLVPRRFRIFGTGNPMQYEHDLKYIGTAQMSNHALVWHIFEEYIQE